MICWRLREPAKRVSTFENPVRRLDLMPEHFDAYHTWLGIPPSEQPPHHYRLLGITVFESNLDVIEHAADRQMAHLRSLNAGKRATLTQDVLDEVAKARVCLMDAKKKAAY